MLSVRMQSKKRIIHAVSGMLLLAATAAAQSQPPCNTGYKPATGTCGTLWPNGSYNPETGGSAVDGHWQLATPYPSSPSNPNTGTAAQMRLIEDPCSAKFGSAWVDYPDGESPAPPVFGYWSIDGPASNWISPQNEVNALGGLYIYKQTFKVPASWTSPVTITGRLQSDNETYSIYGFSPAATRCQYLAGLHYNGSAFLGSAISGPTGFLTWTPFTTTHTFAVVPSSAAILYFIVRNRGYEGLDTNTTPAGLRVEFDTATVSNLTQAGGGDFNADGQTDVAVVDSGTNKVAVFLNDGKGFPKDSEYPVGTNPAFVAVGDLNGDGRPDLAVANAGSASVSILLNTGKGAFGKAANYPAGTNPVAVAIGDFNGDGKPDLAVANAESGTISILSGEGGGKFQLTQTVPAGDPTESSPSSLAVGDFNGDGKLDLALTDAGTGVVTILTGNGDGTFTLLSSIASEAIEPVSIVAADFNGDGKPDLAVADPATNAVYVLLGNGDGTFQPAVGYPAGSDPQSLIIGTPPPGSSLPFLAVADPASSVVTVLQSNGDGTFRPGQTYPVGTTPVSVVSVTSPSGTSLAVVDNATNSVIELTPIP